MKIENEKMKLIDFIRPVLADGKHSITVTQNVVAPEMQTFTAAEDFYVSGRAYTLDVNDVFSVSPTENENGDFSQLLPFITLSNKAFPWERRIAEDISGVPVPWVALIVLSSREDAAEADLTLAQLLNNVPGGTYFPDKKQLPPVVVEKEDDVCHIVDISAELYESILPSFEDMVCLTHARRVNLADTEDDIAAKDGDFSVILANRFVPTGDNASLKSTVHLVSLLGMPRAIPRNYAKVRLVSLHRWSVQSVRDNSETFQNLIDELSKNTGIIGCDKENDVLRRGYVPKKHRTRSGESTYSLYRSPLIPYANKAMDNASRHTADGHLIYDPQKGVFDASYAAAFQLGRWISLSRQTDGKAVTDFRKRFKAAAHKELLYANIHILGIRELCEKLTKDVSG